MGQDGFGQAGFSLIDSDLGFIPGIILFGRLAEFVGIVTAPEKAPAFVDHDKAGRVDLHGIAGAHNQGTSGHGHSIHNACKLRTVSGQLTQAVVYGI